MADQLSRAPGDQLRSLVVSEPARWGLRRRVLDGLDQVHLARPAVRLYELALAAKGAASSRRLRTENDLPLPPARLRAQIGPAHADASFFLRSGRRHAELVSGLLGAHGASVEQLDAILDFGCGCGRVVRCWAALPA
ncbi:MAG: hypothetical protein C5B48_01855, partial [Candidatus Rokuibacteriota bacterium]